MGNRVCNLRGTPEDSQTTSAMSSATRSDQLPGLAPGQAPGPEAPAKAQGQVQQAFASQADWEAVFGDLRANGTVKEHYGEVLDQLDEKALKLLQVRTLVPLAKARLAARPGALSAARSGVLNGYRDFAEKKGIEWRTDAARLEGRGPAVWEAERAAIRREMAVPAYYKACYEGPIHSYDKGNGEWAAAFDAPSAYLLVHLHHFPGLAPQEAFDALHAELGSLALRHLPASGGSPVRCVDVGCGVGTSTFSTARALLKAGRPGRVTGVDLSDYFVTVARHLQTTCGGDLEGKVALEFLHGDGLDLGSSGFGGGSLDLVTISEVTHEMPKKVSEDLFVEAARVLAAGGVLAYMDLNPAQILKDNAVGSLVDRIATSNEPYFDEYLELDAAGALRAAGLEVLEETWPNCSKYPTLESCSLRIIIARKPSAAVTRETWTGKWSLDRRENWSAYLSFLGVPAEAHAGASLAPDFHEYVVGETSFFMDHRIPGKGMHLRFTGFVDDALQPSPYPKPTAQMFSDKAPQEEKPNVWKHCWVDFPVSFKTTMPDFAGKGKTVTMTRELDGPDAIKYTVHVVDPDTHEPLVGPCHTWMRRTSSEAPQGPVEELKEKFAAGVSRSLEWRLAALDRAAALALENVDAISAAQAADHVSPASFTGASMMLKGALAFYKANLAAWAAPQRPAETLPPFMQTEGEWEVVPEPKGVGLVIAPWNAPVLLCVLPLMGMLAAGNLCVLKPSEAAPATSRLLAQLAQRYFPDRSVLVAEGGKEVVQGLIGAKVDHVLFTGGGETGKRILELAAPHLTPVSLELGGKNPCFVDVADSAQLALYAAEIVGTKRYFGGQFCQAHDYCLVHERVFDEFVALLEGRIVALEGQRNCQMINTSHAARVRALLSGQEACARPPLPAEVASDCVPVTVLLLPDASSPVMREEIFGPLLPVLKVSGAQEAAEFVRQRPKPLVAYCYSPEEAAWAAFRDSTSSGNLAVNCGPQRMQSNFNVGFGGVGESGFGYSIWGKASFDDFSNRKTVFRGRKFAGSVWGAAPPQGPPQGYPQGKPPS